MTQGIKLFEGTSGRLLVPDDPLADNLYLKWDPDAQLWLPAVGGGGGGDVASVFGRAGVVIAEFGDYNSDLVENVSDVDGATVSEALDSLELRTTPITQGATISADVTVDVSGGFLWPIEGQAANITIHLSTAGASDSMAMLFERRDAPAFTVTFVNDGTLGGSWTIPVSVRRAFSATFAAGNWSAGQTYGISP